MDKKKLPALGAMVLFVTAWFLLVHQGLWPVTGLGRGASLA